MYYYKIVGVAVLALTHWDKLTVSSSVGADEFMCHTIVLACTISITISSNCTSPLPEERRVPG